MKRMLLLSTALLAACAAPAPGTDVAAPAPGPLKLEKVVMLMRHGIRPPTKAAVVPPGYSSETWPAWPVDFGLLTPRGAAGAKLLGESDRAYFGDRGLFSGGCPVPGTIVLKASYKERTINTAQSWAAGFMPGCAADVAHPAGADDDAIFHGLDGGPASFDGKRAYDAALAEAPEGGLAAETERHRGELTLLAKVLNCAVPACPLVAEPSRLVAQPHDRPDLEGPLDVGSTASQTLLLEYLEGKPMKEVGWGRVSRPEIEQLLRFHPLKFRYSNRPGYIAAAAAAPIVGEIVDALGDRSPARLTLLAGHDTNVADLGGFFDFHWQVPSYPADEVPPGSALGFELVSNARGDRYVRAFYRAQTMDQLRNLEPLDGANTLFRHYLPIPGCGNSAEATACRWDAFTRLAAPRG
ncbi:4-phytase/acid phosphatase [Sphingopyxis panaciterrae]|uniref:histidine-type phosphatase n=1 Tax=Sphingopyxis panaciterrae TaxID=363841 RepID=UPI00142045B1|nr:histidine-type phosphatase [Sphingopyxis panaciterrae]NIJ38791.1 4-phytase/acid phosphatase [Sphingopyxis panaciterrae]